MDCHKKKQVISSGDRFHTVVLIIPYHTVVLTKTKNTRSSPFMDNHLDSKPQKLWVYTCVFIIIFNPDSQLEVKYKPLSGAVCGTISSSKSVIA